MTAANQIEKLRRVVESYALAMRGHPDAARAVELREETRNLPDRVRELVEAANHAVEQFTAAKMGDINCVKRLRAALKGVE